jgi:hypothetical protein
MSSVQIDQKRYEMPRERGPASRNSSPSATTRYAT